MPGTLTALRYRSDAVLSGAVPHAASRRHGRRRDQGRAARGLSAAPSCGSMGTDKTCGRSTWRPPQQALAVPRPQEAARGSRSCKDMIKGCDLFNPNTGRRDRADWTDARGAEESILRSFMPTRWLCAQGPYGPQAPSTISCRLCRVRRRLPKKKKQERVDGLSPKFNAGS